MSASPMQGIEPWTTRLRVVRSTGLSYIGTLTEAITAHCVSYVKKYENTHAGDRTLDHTIKSRALYRTELHRRAY
jgi:hypothetical protein